MPRVIPFGDRILVRRRRIGETIGKEGLIVAPDRTKDTITDLADVIAVPEHSLTDKQLIDNSEKIIESLNKKAQEGDPLAFTAQLQFGAYLKHKMVRPGDCIMIGKYVGIDFSDNSGGNSLTLVREERFSQTIPEKAFLSTARAEPAGTLVLSAALIISESSIRISCLRTPGAVFWRLE